LDEAISAYDRGDHQRAVGLFRKASQLTDGNAMIALSGLYQSYFKLNSAKEAGEVFARLVALGMRRGNLGVKFLFEVNKTDFFVNGEQERLQIHDEYQIWLREIAKNIVTSKNCVQVVGHASASGTPEHNQILSEQRAGLIYQSLQTQAPGVDKKAVAIG